ncbi:WD repeat domain-containing protein 83-like protein [Halteromyces radiatus]|uniref:WD repeat domain-containing protein 83-like protein n=1 Tax=Halteromyces radiatus TaxID=101107 RepID=UPI0022207DEA|nr:WD repeat domain-containing protein 83-like protein [Halteromyces radiatus]KAI8099087.1 WD repeat domain-containing protein 83-like protein [Halteromyces radiatus]
MSSYPTQCTRTITGHKGPINALRYNTSGQYCLSGGKDRSVRLWNPTSGLHLHSYEGHGREVLGLSVSQDNARIASCGADKAVILWDVSSGSLLRRFTSHWERVNAVDFNQEGTVLVSGSFDATIRIWDCRSSNLQAIQVIEGCKDSIMSLQVKDKEIITGCADGKLRRFDIRQGQLYEDYIGSPITSSKISGDGNCILINTMDDTIRLMDKTNGQLLNSFKGHRQQKYKIESALTYDDAHVISGSEDGHIYIWNVLEGNLMRTLDSHSGTISTLDCHPSKGVLISGGDDGMIRLWE